MYVHPTSDICKQAPPDILIEEPEEADEVCTALQHCLGNFLKIIFKTVERKGEDKHICQASEVERQCDRASLAAPLTPSPGCSIRISAAAARLMCSRALFAWSSLVQFHLPTFSSIFDSRHEGHVAWSVSGFYTSPFQHDPCRSYSVNPPPAEGQRGFKPKGACVKVLSPHPTPPLLSPFLKALELTGLLP